MYYAIVSAGMPHTLETTKHFSLGGSETAAVEMARELALRGHDVTLFHQSPPQDRVDYVQHGTRIEGVIHMDINSYKDISGIADYDVLIVSRIPQLLNTPHQAKRCFLWMHDLATPEFADQIGGIGWNCDGILTVSEFHKQQVHEATGYPLSHIYPVRNGIMRVPDHVQGDWDALSVGDAEFRIPNQFYFGSRLERGAWFILQPGGIADQMPEAEFRFSMYGTIDNLPDQVKQLYVACLQRIEQLPNCTFLGELYNTQVRAELRTCEALIYPSGFSETSCILAREAIEARCPVIACDVGALPETLGLCGSFMAPRQKFESDAEFISTFVGHVKTSLIPDAKHRMAEACEQRHDLYWDGAAELLEAQTNLDRPVPFYSRAYGLVEMGDVVPARAVLMEAEATSCLTLRGRALLDQIDDLYPFLAVAPDIGQTMLKAHYDAIFTDEPAHWQDLGNNARFQSMCRIIAEEAANKQGSELYVVDYGCSEGNQIMNMAQRFPNVQFIGYDHSKVVIEKARARADEIGLKNIYFCYKKDRFEIMTVKPDLIFCTEVLEHCIEPWKVIIDVESLVHSSGRIVFTTPIGPWEAISCYSRQFEYLNRQHIWHLDRVAFDLMLQEHEEVSFSMLGNGRGSDGVTCGNLIVSYRKSQSSGDTFPINPIDKAYRSPYPKQICCAAVIAYNNENEIGKMLKSLSDIGIRHVQIAHGPSTDRTAQRIIEFVQDHPWMNIEVIEAPKIEAGKFGFDDARNLSIYALRSDFEWALWIDTDEFMIGGFRPYLRESANDTYAIHQHHFTVEPRGGAIQIDRPARLIRLNRGLEFCGKIHEHAEVGGINGGPGYSFLLQDCDIFHTGYQNEAVRRSRFERNFPFLEWDREVNPDRDLTKFLWLRDLVHIMRFNMQANNGPEVHRLATEAVEHYNAHWKEIMKFGQGSTQGFEYASEARRALGLGIPVANTVALEDGRQVTFNGMVEDPEELTRLIKWLLDPECEKARKARDL